MMRFDIPDRALIPALRIPDECPVCGGGYNALFYSDDGIEGCDSCLLCEGTEDACPVCGYVSERNNNFIYRRNGLAVGCDHCLRKVE